MCAPRQLREPMAQSGPLLVSLLHFQSIVAYPVSGNEYGAHSFDEVYNILNRNVVPALNSES
jgi:hypothetical protein